MRQSNYPRDFSHREVPFSQMNRPLKESELSGFVARELGLLPVRQMQPSVTTVLQRDPRHVAFVHPPLRANVPLPSASRPAPRRPESCA